MKKLAWRFLYSVRIKKFLRLPWRMCWENSAAAIENLGDDWKTETPEDTADEEIHCWIYDK